MSAAPSQSPRRRKRKAATVAPKPFAGMLQQAIQAHQADDLDLAERLYGEVLEMRVAQPDALHFLGVLNHQRGRSDAAVSLIEAALKITPGHPDAHNNLGNVHKECGRLAEAERCYRRALDSGPGHYQALSNLAVVLEAQERLDEAFEAYSRLLRQAPTYAHGHYRLGVFLRTNAQHEQHLEQSAECFRLAYRYDQRNVRALEGVGVALYMLGRHERGGRGLPRLADPRAGQSGAAPHAGFLRRGRGSRACGRRLCSRGVRRLCRKFRRAIAEQPGLSRAGGAGRRACRGTAGAVAPARRARCRLRHRPVRAADPRARAPAGRGGSLRRHGGQGACPRRLRRSSMWPSSPPGSKRIRGNSTWCCRRTRWCTSANSCRCSPQPAARCAATAGSASRWKRSKVSDDRVELGSSGRYRHSRAYVERVLATTGFTEISIRVDTLRREAGKPVLGWVVRARRAAMSGGA